MYSNLGRDRGVFVLYTSDKIKANKYILASSRVLCLFTYGFGAASESTELLGRYRK